MHPTQAIFLFVAALIAGTLNSIAGGGSFVSFPALLFLRMPPVEANATNTVALWPGLAASSGAYLKRLAVPPRILVPLVATSIAGGLAGALLLVKTPPHTFMHLVPWLLLAGTLLFAFGNKFRVLARHDRGTELAHTSWKAITIISALELAVGIYGGYFGAGIGFITLGMLSAIGMTDIHNINALRTLLATVINAVAVATFILAGKVLWLVFLTMTVGAMTGGWFGAHFSQKADPRKLRALVIFIGLSMSAYFFIKTY